MILLPLSGNICLRAIDEGRHMTVINGIVQAGLAIPIFIFCRILGMFLTGPVYSSPRLPGRYRIGAAVVLSIVPVSVSGSLWNSPPGHVVKFFIIALAGELIVGAIIGLVTSLFLESFRLSGTILDHGSRTLANSSDTPFDEGEDSLFARIAMVFAFLVFLLADLHHLLIKAVYDSFAVFPPGMVALVDPGENITRLMIQAGGCIFSTALNFAFPPLFLFFLFQLFLNAISFSVPSVSDASSDGGFRAIASMGMSVAALFIAVNYVTPLVVSSLSLTGLGAAAGN